MAGSNPIPMNDLGRRVRRHRTAIDAAIARVLASGHFVLGPETERFEAAFAASIGVAHCVGVANGTDALEIALRCLDLPAGSTVATVANAGMYASTAILAAGLRPLYVDVDAGTANMQPAALAEALNLQPAAIVVTHLYGRMADMPALTALADAAGVPVIEDCAQAHGATRDGRAAGAWGTIGCYSFYPTKNLGGLGDGGAVVTNADGLADRARRLRQYGWAGKYRADTPGGRNSRLDELQAAVLSELLPLLPADNDRRRDIAAQYDQAIGAAANDRLAPRGGPGDVAHLYVTCSRDRTATAAALSELGIASAIHYPVPDHRQPALAGAADAPLPLVNTERLCDGVLSLPCFPEMTDGELARVLDALRTLPPRVN